MRRVRVARDQDAQVVSSTVGYGDRLIIEQAVFGLVGIIRVFHARNVKLSLLDPPSCSSILGLLTPPLTHVVDLVDALRARKQSSVCIIEPGIQKLQQTGVLCEPPEE